VTVEKSNKKKPTSSNKKGPNTAAAKKNGKAANAKKKLSMSKGIFLSFINYMISTY